MKILAVSDRIEDKIYGPACRRLFSDVDMVISCGDLPYYYIEFITSMLDVPVYFVRGNHASRVEYSAKGGYTAPRGAVDLHTRMIHKHGLLMAGIEGSVRYNRGDFQYSQGEMWAHVLRFVPALLYNRIAFGRFLDIFVSHAPPRGIHDKPDPAHVGANAFRWLLKTFRPSYHFHGHIHRYHHEDPAESTFHSTRVVNAYGYRVLDLMEV